MVEVLRTNSMNISYSIDKVRLKDESMSTSGKTLYTNGREWAAKHKPNGIRAYLCEDKPNQPCVWLP